LIYLFPDYTWHIYENLPLSYELKKADNVNLYNRELTKDEAKKWKDKVDLYISDFRKPVQSNTISLKREEIPLQERVENMIYDDFLNEVDLIYEILPIIGACLKFKTKRVDPTSRENIDIPNGEMLWLPWKSNTSMDGTLVIHANEIKNKTKMNIYLANFQNSYAMHNRYYRPWGYYKIPKQFSETINNIQGFCHCFDCVCEFITISNYINLNIIKEPIDQIINQLSYKLDPIIKIKEKNIYHRRFPSMLPAIRIKYISSIQNIGRYSNIKINSMNEYLQRLKKYADQYDEFSIYTVTDTKKHLSFDKDTDNKKHLSFDKNTDTKKHLSFDKNTEYNLKIAKELLSSKFKNIYTPKEEKIILHTTSKIFTIPSIWNDLKNELVYRGDKDTLAHNYIFCHLGQRKLFMAELQLLNRFLPDVNTRCIILYIGAAAGYHLPLLFNLFPNTIWHLYDPSPFCSNLIKMNLHRDNKRVYLYNDFFTDDVANSWKNKCDIFISDIRLNADTRSTFESQVENDMRRQENWTLTINPTMGASLKFRPPYLDPNINQSVYKYIRGKIMWQMWPPRNSTECRLIVDARDINDTMELDIIKYQNSCAYHNIIDRAWKTYELPKEKDGRICTELNKVIGYDRCFDCTCEAICWLQYKELKNAKKKPINEYFDDLTNITHQKLKNKKSFHGFVQYEMSASRLINLI